MTLNEISEYEVILRNGEEKCIVADNFEHRNDGLFFYKECESVAWFNPHDIIGYRKVKEYVVSDDGDTVCYEEEQEHG